jgi:hypothetical protein
MTDPNRADPIEESDGEGNRDPSLAPAISTDNDQDSHVSPPDNDGETIPSDEVVEQVGG